MNVFSTAILIIFCSLLGSAFSFKCLSCSPLNSTVCTAKSIDCPTDQCMTVSQTATYGGETFISVFKSCADKALCGGYGSVTEHSNVKIRVSATCCDGTNCNTNPFYIKDDPKPNGVKCPSAYCEDSTEKCTKGLKMMACTGSETCCYEYRGRIANPENTEKDYSSMGCINPLACECNFKCLRQLKEKKRVLLKCCDKVQP